MVINRYLETLLTYDAVIKAKHFHWKKNSLSEFDLFIDGIKILHYSLRYVNSPETNTFVTNEERMEFVYKLFGDAIVINNNSKRLDVEEAFDKFLISKGKKKDILTKTSHD